MSSCNGVVNLDIAHLYVAYHTQYVSLARSCRIFELLRWRVGTLLLGGASAISGAYPFLQPFAQLSPSAREAVLQGWARSRIPKILEV